MSAESHLNTLCLHAGEKPPAGSHEKHVLHSHTFPIFQTSTFIFDDADMGAQLFAKQREGFIYSRISNPTVEKFESVVAELEHGVNALAFGSGMGAVSGAIMPFVGAGDHVVCSRVMYGPSVHLVSTVLKRFAVDSTVIDSTNIEEVRKSVIPGKTKVVYIETPGNPLCSITDIAECAKIAHDAGAILIVDSTFASPIFQQPLLLGADVSLHSITKYINGHGDVVGGVVASKSLQHHALIKKWRQDTGGILGPQDAWLALRGVRTLALRMQKHNENALAVARYLQKHPKVVDVMYPGLESFHNHHIAKKQMTGFGGTLSFNLKSYEAAKKLIESTKLASLAVSLGTLDTLIEHPRSMTHASVPLAQLKEQGLTEELVRLSVGLEDVADIIADLEQAFEKI